MTENKIEAPVYSETWMKRFDFFKKNGAPNTESFKEAIKQSSFQDRVVIGMNFWALFFGFIYFFIKGMWKGGLVLLGIGLTVGIISIFLPDFLLRGLGIALGIFSGMIANYNFYRKEILGEDDYNILKGIRL